MLQAQGFSLDSISKDVQEYASDVRAPPIDKIPQTPSVCGESISSRFSIIESADGDQDLDFDDDLGRGETRKMYLQGLRNLVPEFKHAPINQEMASGHFSLLQIIEKGDKMPFLGEMFQQVSKSVKKGTNKRDMVKKITHLYPTTQPAEGGLMQPRVIPKELRQFVPVNVVRTWCFRLYCQVKAYYI